MAMKLKSNRSQGSSKEVAGVDELWCYGKKDVSLHKDRTK